MVYYLRAGGTSFGTILCNINSVTGEIRQGSSTTMGTIIGRIDGDRIRLGNNAPGFGDTVLFREGNNLRSGNIWGTIVAHWDGDYLRSGNSPQGPIIAVRTTY